MNIHLFLKVHGEDTVARHSERIEAYDAVWWGHKGKYMASAKYQQITEQLNSKQETFAYLYSTYSQKITHVARVIDVFQAIYKRAAEVAIEDEEHLVPEYYRGDTANIWLKFDDISSINHEAVFAKLGTLEAKPVPLKSRNSMMYVYRTPDSTPKAS